MIQIAGYGRASTDKQQLTLEQQRTIIRQWFDRQCEGGGFEGQEPSFLGTFIDGVSTKAHLLDRPVGQGCQEVLRLVEQQRRPRFGELTKDALAIRRVRGLPIGARPPVGWMVHAGVDQLERNSPLERLDLLSDIDVVVGGGEGLSFLFTLCSC